MIERLPQYYRLVSRLEAEGRSVVSSQDLGEDLGVTPAQLRKDLSYFGKFGKQGRGYSVPRLADALRSILGLDRRWTMVVVGVGRLGHAISSYPRFADQGFDIVGAYDSNPTAVGTQVGDLVVRDVSNMDDDLRLRPVDIGIVTVPAEAAQSVVDRLVRVGVHAILNYAPTRVQVPEGIQLKQINPVLFLQSMTYHLKQSVERRDQREMAGPTGSDSYPEGSTRRDA